MTNNLQRSIDTIFELMEYPNEFEVYKNEYLREGCLYEILEKVATIEHRIGLIRREVEQRTADDEDAKEKV